LCRLTAFKVHTNALPWTQGVPSQSRKLKQADLLAADEEQEVWDLLDDGAGDYEYYDDLAEMMDEFDE
jgi:hypothetical protein